MLFFVLFWPWGRKRVYCSPEPESHTPWGWIILLGIALSFWKIAVMLALLVLLYGLWRTYRGRRESTHISEEGLVDTRNE